MLQTGCGCKKLLNHSRRARPRNIFTWTTITTPTWGRANPGHSGIGVRADVLRQRDSQRDWNAVRSRNSAMRHARRWLLQPTGHLIFMPTLIGQPMLRFEAILEPTC